MQTEAFKASVWIIEDTSRALVVDMKIVSQVKLFINASNLKAMNKSHF